MDARCRRLVLALAIAACCLAGASSRARAEEGAVTPLTPGTPVAGTLADAEQIDRYQIDVTGADPLYISLLKPAPWAGYLEVRQGEIGGPIVARVEDTGDPAALAADQWLEVAAPVPGAYFISVRVFDPTAPVTTPLAYTLAAGQQWTPLSAVPAAITLAGPHSLRWFKLPAIAGQPLHAFADHNSDNGLRMEIVRGSLAGPVVASASGPRDLLVYLSAAESGHHFLKVSDATVTQCHLTAGTHLPRLTADTVAEATLVNDADVHWYEAPLAAGEEALLHLDKQSAFPTAVPLFFTSPVNPQSTGATGGDVTAVLKPATATTYFVRVTGAAGSYRLSAARRCPVIPRDQWVDAPMAHAGDERWFEVTIPANHPFWLMTNKEREGAVLVEVYRPSLQTRVVQFTSEVSEYRYLPPRATETRYIIRKRAAETNFLADPAERLFAGTALPSLAAGQTIGGNIARNAQRRFYQLDMSGGRPLVLHASLPLQLDEPASGRTLHYTAPLALAGLGEPVVITIASPTPTSYSVSATTNLQGIGALFFRNAHLEATVDLAKTTVHRIRYLAGSDTYLAGEVGSTHGLHLPEGTDYAAGWTLLDAVADGAGLQLSWRHAATQVTKSLLLRATAQRAELCCLLDSPRPLTVRNALMPPSPAGGTHTYAVPMGTVVSNSYAQSGTTALYPSAMGGMISPTERWAAFWNSAVNEVYGVTLAPMQRIALLTDGASTVTRVLCPAGRTAFTMVIARPRPTPPYQPLQSGAAHPVLAVEHAADAPLVPVGSAITGSLTVRNVGSGSATNLTATCILPEHAVYIEGSAGANGAYAAGTRTVTWTLSALAADAEAVLRYGYRIDPAVPHGTVMEIAGAAACQQRPVPTLAISYTRVAPPALAAVLPETTGNAGPVTLALRGSCLSESAVVTLAQLGQVLTGVNVGLRPDRSELRVLVDVTGLSGAWDVAVTNPGGAAAILPAALALTPGGEDIFWCDLTAPRTLGLGEWTTVQVQYGNRGAVNARDRVLVLYLPPARFGVASVRDDFGHVLASADLVGSLAGPLLFRLPQVGPGASHSLSIEMQVLAATGGTGVYPQATLAAGTLTLPQLATLLERATAEVLSVTTAHRPHLAALIPDAVERGLTRWNMADAQPCWSMARELVVRMRADATLAPYLTQPDAAITGIIVERMLVLLKAGDGVPPPAVKSEYLPTIAATPGGNLMTGPLGYGPQGYVMAGQPFRYRISCVNPAQATAAVKDILVTDVLSNALDWSTLRLESMRIGSKTFDLNGATLPYQGYIDLRPNFYGMAEVTVTFNAEQGILLWRVVGYHPLTGVRYDVLPPNSAQNAPLGTAEFTFTIAPRIVSASGATITNKATITFDGGAPLLTNTAVNTLDAGPPSSAVRPLPSVQEDAAFIVEWAGEDDPQGSGVRSYSIYVSDNEGPYTCWQYRVTNTSATFTGSYGHVYRFYSLAEDGVGHVERTPDAPDAMIKIGREVTMGRGLRLVSVPVIPDMADPKAVMGFAAEKWARYVPGSGYVSYGNDPGRLTWFEPASAVPGRAYWGYWNEERIIDVAGTVPPPTTPYAIELVNGWNLIGNPWTKRVLWDTAAIKVSSAGQTKTLAEAAQLGWINDYAWGWVAATSPTGSGQYWMVADASIVAAQRHLEAWRGYWVKTTRACTLLLPPPAQSPPPAQGSTRRLLASGWQARLVARAASGEDGFNWFGMGSRQDVARTRALETPPPALTPGVELSFGARAVDLREVGTANPVWQFTVTSPQAEEVTLCWPDLTAVPHDLGLMLVNELTGERRNMRTTSEYRFVAPEDAAPVPFRIETARRGLLRVLSLSAAPSDARAGGVHIRYTLTQEATATVEVRTVTGRLVRTLAGPRTPADTPASVIWDGKAANAAGLPRGLYLLVLTARTDDGTSVRAVTTCETR